MEKKESKSNATNRREERFPQLSEFSMNYEGYTEDIVARPPGLMPHGMFLNSPRKFPEGPALKSHFRLFRSDIVSEAGCEARCRLKQLGAGVEFMNHSAENIQTNENEIAVLTHCA